MDGIDLREYCKQLAAKRYGSRLKDIEPEVVSITSANTALTQNYGDNAYLYVGYITMAGATSANGNMDLVLLNVNDTLGVVSQLTLGILVGGSSDNILTTTLVTFNELISSYTDPEQVIQIGWQFSGFRIRIR